MNWYILRCKEGNGFVAKRIFNKVYFHQLYSFGSVMVEEFTNQFIDRIVLNEMYLKAE